MLLSLSAFLFEEDGHVVIDLAHFCELARDAGYTGVELRRSQANPSHSRQERSVIRRRCDAAGLRVTCLAARDLPAGGQARNDLFAAYVQLCVDLGCPLLKVYGNPAWIRWAAAHAADHGVRVASNNHIDSVLETINGTRTYLAAVGHANFGLLYDCMHLMLAGQPYVACIEEFLPLTRNILVHSLRPAASGEQAHFVHKGRRWCRALPDDPAAQAWRLVFEAFLKGGYAGPITVIESGWPRQQRREVATRCAAVIKAMCRRQETWKTASALVLSARAPLSPAT